MAALPATLGRIFDLGVGMTLVCVSEPRSALLLTADQRNPLIATAAEAFPDIRVSVHAPCLLWLLERAASRSADTVREALVVPKRRVLQHEPSAGLADAAPSFALVAVTTHPLGSVQVAIKAKFLLMRDKVRVRWVHVLRGRRDLLLV